MVFACGIINNYNQLEVIVSEQNPDFIILSETLLTWDIEEQEIQLTRYNSYITHSISKKTVELLFISDNNIQCNKNWRKVF